MGEEEKNTSADMSSLLDEAEKWANQKSSHSQSTDFDDPNSYPIWVPVEEVASQVAIKLCQNYQLNPESGATDRSRGKQCGDFRQSLRLLAKRGLLDAPVIPPLMEVDGHTFVKVLAAKGIIPAIATGRANKDRQKTVSNKVKPLADLSTIYEDSATTTSIKNSLVNVSEPEQVIQNGLPDNLHCASKDNINSCDTKTYTIHRADEDSYSDGSDELNKDEVSGLEHGHQNMEKNTFGNVDKENATHIMGTAIITAPPDVEVKQLPGKNNIIITSNDKLIDDAQKATEASILKSPETRQNSDSRPIIIFAYGDENNINSLPTMDKKTVSVKKDTAAAVPKRTVKTHPDKANKNIYSTVPKKTMKGTALTRKFWSAPRNIKISNCDQSSTKTLFSDTGWQGTPQYFSRRENLSKIKSLRTPPNTPNYGPSRTMFEKRRITINELENKFRQLKICDSPLPFVHCETPDRSSFELNKEVSNSEEDHQNMEKNTSEDLDEVNAAHIGGTDTATVVAVAKTLTETAQNQAPVAGGCKLAPSVPTAKAESATQTGLGDGFYKIFTVSHDKNHTDLENNLDLKSSLPTKLIVDTTYKEQSSSPKMECSIVDRETETQVTPAEDEQVAENNNNQPVQMFSAKTSKLAFSTVSSVHIPAAEKQSPPENMSQEECISMAAQTEQACGSECNRTNTLDSYRVNRDGKFRTYSMNTSLSRLNSGQCIISGPPSVDSKTYSIRSNSEERTNFFHKMASPAQRKRLLTPGSATRPAQTAPRSTPQTRTIRAFLHSSATITPRSTYDTPTTAWSIKKQCLKSDQLIKSITPSNPPKKPNELPLENRASRLKAEYLAKKRAEKENETKFMTAKSLTPTMAGRLSAMRRRSLGSLSNDGVQSDNSGKPGTPLPPKPRWNATVGRNILPPISETPQLPRRPYARRARITLTTFQNP